MMIKGSIVALVTPMHSSGEVDYDTLRKLIDWHVEQETDAIVVVGTTGESATLDVNEHCQVIEQVVKHTNQRVPVIAGTGANSTSEALELTQAAKDLAVDACLLVTPYYNKPTQEGLYQHYKRIAETVDIPQILYNVPGRTACDMLPETVKRLAAIDNIIGIKEATGDVGRGVEIMALCAAKEGGKDFAVYSGDDAVAVDLILAGAQGNISVTANIVPKQMHEVCAAALAGNADEAKRINGSIAQLHRTLFLEANPIPVKWALQQLDRIDKGIRLPLLALDTQYHSQLRLSMEQAGIL